MAKSKKRVRQKSNSVVSQAPRNPFAHHPLMSKGGVHQKSQSSLRSKARRETRQLARDWASSFQWGQMNLKFY
ncbi:MAG: hypothetical protein OEY19_02715 [Gammaproteobacteria bacterium]|nr:hypothetical protein [Gammaproteobacteria bacterium]MDH5629138.1 hypothetical protein [Gammaproteobacteria bacterium]